MNESQILMDRQDHQENDCIDEHMEDNGEFYLYATRYTLLQRLHHWANLYVMLVLFATGLEIFNKKFIYKDFIYTQELHIKMAYAVFYIGIVIYVLMLVATKKYKHVIPLPTDIINLILILACGLKIMKECNYYPHYDFYNPEKKKYVMKYHPTQKLLATGNFGALLLIGISGFALLKDINPNATGLLIDAAVIIAAPFVELGVDLRLTHFILFSYFVMSTSIHFYFAVLLKANRGRLRGMILGKEKLHFSDPKFLPYLKDHTNPSIKDQIKSIPDNIKNTINSIREKFIILITRIKKK